MTRIAANRDRMPLTRGRTTSCPLPDGERVASAASRVRGGLKSPSPPPLSPSGRGEKSRPAFTLVELLVVMAVIIVLAAIAIVVVPDILAQDRTTDGAALTRQYLMIAKSRAARDNLPRGVRLIVGLDPNNVQKTNALWVTEMQYTEAPPVLLPVSDQTPQAPIGAWGSPAVLFVYSTNAGALVTPPTCYLLNLPQAAFGQMQLDLGQGRQPLLYLPVLGTWHRVTNLVPTSGPPTDPAYITAGGENYRATLSPAPTGPGSPDDQIPIGAATNFVTYHFGIYGAPRPLLGEPTLQLPRNICVDLSVSSPSWSVGATPPDYDILFAPSGVVVPMPGTAGAATGQINLWVRDYTKTPSPLVVTSAGPPVTYDMTPFQKGGEQQVVALKTKSGSLGTFPIMWPTAGVYASGQGPFTFAQTGATGP